MNVSDVIVNTDHTFGELSLQLHNSWAWCSSSSTMQQQHDAAAQCSSTMQQHHAAAPCSSSMQQHHAAAPCSSRALILLLHLYLLAFFKFFSKLNIIFFFLQFNIFLFCITILGVILYITTGLDAYLSDSSRCLVYKHNRTEHVCNRIVLYHRPHKYCDIRNPR